MFGDLYRGKRVLVIGHTGFKGSWLCSWLKELGAEVYGYSLGVPSEPSNHQVLGHERLFKQVNDDVRDLKALAAMFADVQPAVVFHLAAQAIVRESYADPVGTISTNAIGTANVLECLRMQPSVKAAVLITSDKCYENVEWLWGYREIDRLGGKDPYSASKACAELISYAYMQSFFTDQGPMVATVRAGNVIGGGDWAADRIVPDCMRAWSQGDTVRLRKPKATRPWQHVLEPLSGYLWLAALMLSGSNGLRKESFNFGPNANVNQSVEELISALSCYWSDAHWMVDADSETSSESTLLRLNCDKAHALLGWHAALDFENTVRLTSEWYQRYYQQGHEGMLEYTKSQIHEYQQIANLQGLAWATE